MTIKEYRLNKNVTQQELADIVGVNVLSIKRYENGQRIPAVDIAARIGEALGIPEGELLGLFNGGTV